MGKLKKFLLSVSVVVLLMLLTIIPTFAVTLKPDSSGSTNEEITVYRDLMQSSYYGVNFGYGSAAVFLIVPVDFETADVGDCYIPVIQMDDHFTFNMYGGAYYTPYFKENIVDYVLENKTYLEEKFDTVINYDSQSVFNFINTKDFFDQDYRIISVYDINFDSFQRLYETAYSDKADFISKLETGKNFNSVLEFDDFDKEYGSYIELFGKKKELSELSTTVTEQGLTISGLEKDKLDLEGDKALLENDVKDLNSQIKSIAEEKIKLSAQIKALENQLQLKINKAYAEGLVDSEGGLTTSGIISIFAVVLTFGELIALVVFFVSKAKKRKHR